MITSDTGISLEILASIAAGIVAWVGSYMTTRTKVDNLQNAVNTLTNDISDIYTKIQEETKTVKSDINSILDKLEQETKTKCSQVEGDLNNIRNELFNTKIELQKYQEDKCKSVYNKIDVQREHINSLDIVVRELEIKVSRLYDDIDKHLDAKTRNSIDNIKETIELLITILGYKDGK